LKPAPTKIQTWEADEIVAKQLNPGDLFPNFTVPITDGRTLNIPADLKGEYAVIIYYRGIW
jgi:peroxiredoxin